MTNNTKKVETIWYGHSTVKIVGSKTILIDPFFDVMSEEHVKEALEGVDFVAVTHGHADHLGQAFDACKKTNAVIVCIAEIADEATKLELDVEPMNIGGRIQRDGVGFNMVFATHSAGNMGSPAGFVIEIDGKKIYHAGDTGLTLEMKLIGEMYRPDLSFLPIGDRYTMGIAHAVKALEFVGSKKVVPIHYNTFPAIEADPNEFKKLVGDKAEVTILEKGGSLTL